MDYLHWKVVFCSFHLMCGCWNLYRSHLRMCWQVWNSISDLTNESSKTKITATAEIMMGVAWQVALYSPLKDSLPWSDCSFRQRSKTQKDGVLRLCDYQQDDFFLSPTVFIGSGFTCGRDFNRYRKLIWQVSLHMGKYLPYCCIYDTSSVISKCQLITTRILGWC